MVKPKTVLTENTKISLGRCFLDWSDESESFDHFIVLSNDGDPNKEARHVGMTGLPRALKERRLTKDEEAAWRGSSIGTAWQRDRCYANGEARHGKRDSAP